VFGAAARAPFTFIIFGFEITRDYNAVLPLMLVTVIATGIAQMLMPYSIMTEKLARRGLRVHQEYEPDIFYQVTVRDVMDTCVPTVPADMALAELAERLAQHDPVFTRHHALPILDADGLLAGIVTRGDIVRALQRADRKLTILEAGSRGPILAYPDETLHAAVARMLRADVGRLLVVERGNPRRLVGYLGRPDIIGARLHRLNEEHLREPGWLSR
jgi:CBS domain-containing protein